MTKSSEPLVTVITPTYNHERFVHACILSVLGQAYSSWEQIIIDDGSTDNTAEVISRIRDPRIRHEHQDNQGPFELARTYNRALSLARGDLVAILEGDDFWPPDKLAAQIPAFADEDTVLAYGEAADVDVSDVEQRTKSYSSRVRERLSQSVLFNNPVTSATRYMLLAEGGSLISPSTVVIRRGALKRIGGFKYVPDLPLTDYPTFMELSLIGRFHYLPQTLGYRRRHQNSITINHEQKIYDIVSDYSMRFLEAHAEKFIISPSERRMIQENWRQAEDKLHFSQGRVLLLKRRWREARSHFRIAARSRKAPIRMASLAGLALSWLHTDMEPLMKLGGRASLRAQGGL